MHSPYDQTKSWFAIVDKFMMLDLYLLHTVAIRITLLAVNLISYIVYCLQSPKKYHLYFERLGL